MSDQIPHRTQTKEATQQDARGNNNFLVLVCKARHVHRAHQTSEETTCLLEWQQKSKHCELGSDCELTMKEGTSNPVCICSYAKTHAHGCRHKGSLSHVPRRQAISN